MLLKSIFVPSVQLCVCVRIDFYFVSEGRSAILNARCSCILGFEEIKENNPENHSCDELMICWQTKARINRR